MIAIADDQAITIIAKYQAKIHEEIPKCQTEERALSTLKVWIRKTPGIWKKDAHNV